MSKVSVHLAASLQEQAAAVASQEGVSMDQFIATAGAEKVATLTTVDYLRQRAKRGNREKLLGRPGEGAGCGAGRAGSSLIRFVRLDSGYARIRRIPSFPG